MYFSMHGPLHTLVMQVHVLVYIRNIQPVVPVLYFVCLAFRRLGDVAKYVTRPSATTGFCCAGARDRRRRKSFLD